MRSTGGQPRSDRSKCTVMASVVRPASEPEAEDPFAQMTVEELKAELLAGLASLFPELRVVAVQGQALIARTRDR